MTTSPAFRVSPLDPQKDSLEHIETWGLRPLFEMLELVADIINNASGDLAGINQQIRFIHSGRLRALFWGDYFDEGKKQDGRKKDRIS